MSVAFSNKLRKLRALVVRCDAEGAAAKLAMLRELAACELPSSGILGSYVELLQFMQAYPTDPTSLVEVEEELDRIERFLARPRNRQLKSLVNSGLPHTPGVSKFSYDLCAWLAQNTDCHVLIDHFEDGSLDLNQVLAITLPSLERSETTSGFEKRELLAALGVARRHELGFLLAELHKVDHSPRLKDLLFDGLGLYVRIVPENRSFSRPFNRVPTPRPFFHDGIQKAFDHRALIEQPLEAPVVLDVRMIQRIIKVVKLSMVLTDRETDPTTYLDERTLRYYELDRGFSAAIYGMMPSRQLPLESYIGYTLFKNGYPVAYGGAWVFGRRADFGINIFEPFRGGESGYALCQLLRLFRQVFGVTHFEIEPYQFGADNPDGITSGAFWFYHRYGFRPTIKELRSLAEKEVVKRKARKDHRTSTRVLMRFTEGNMAMVLADAQHPGVYAIADRVKRLIRTHYKGERARAESESAKKMRARTGYRGPQDTHGHQVLKEVSLWAEATGRMDREQLDLLVRMVETKPNDPYAYQDLLLRFFEKG